MQKEICNPLKSILILLFILSTGSILHCQTLKRKVFLGARLMELSAVEKETGAKSGIYLPMIISEGSLGQMGIPNGAVLQQINDEPVHSIGDLGQVLPGILEGDHLSVVVFVDGERKTYEGKALGRPKEVHPHARVEYGEVVYEDNVLRSLLYLPEGKEKPPVVFFLQGYTCQSIEMRNFNPAKQLIDSWIKDGFAVFLVEKPGMGDSDSKIPCMEIDFDQELHAFSMAYRDLRENVKIDTANIFLFGHSMGGMISPLLAKEHDPAGILVYGIVGNNWYDYMVDIYTEQELLFGTSQEEVNENCKYYLPFLKDMLVHKKSNRELIENPFYGKRLKEDGITQNLSLGYYDRRHYRYWQKLANVDVPGAWANVKCPVLVLHGEYDIQAIHPKYAEMIVTNVNKHGGNASFKLFPKTEHAFLKFDSREELLATMNDGSYVSTFKTHFNSDIARESSAWMSDNTDISYSPFERLINSFDKEFRKLNIPNISLSYVNVLNNIGSAQELERQEQFFSKYQKQLDQIAVCELSEGEQLSHAVLSYEIDLNLQRIALEKKWLAGNYSTEGKRIYDEPMGKEWYAYFLKKWIDKDLEPDGAYQLGLEEIDKVKMEMKSVQMELGLDDASLKQQLSETSYLMTDHDEILKKYEALKAKVRHEAKKYFPDVDKIQEVQIDLGSNEDMAIAPAYYTNNTFYYNFFGGSYESRDMGWIFLHEAIPGHHYQSQVAAAQESTIRDLFSYMGYAEGWGAYVEQYGTTLNAYSTPMDLYFQLQWDLIRSIRVSLDVALNYYGWSDEKALLFWNQHLPDKEDIGRREIKRMKRWPAQVITYKYGKIVLDRLKGEKSNPEELKEFHAQILENGSLPLSVLEEHIRQKDQPQINHSEKIRSF